MTEQEREDILREEKRRNNTISFRKLEPQEVMKLVAIVFFVWWGIIEGNLFRIFLGMFGL